MAEACTPVQNPRETAGFLSLLTISWMDNVLKLGSKIPLEEMHLHPTETASEAEGLVKALEIEWMAEERKCELRRTKPSLWRVLIRIIPSKDIIVMGVLRILWSITMNIFPWVLWLFLKSIATPSQNSYASTLPFVLCLLLTSMVRTVLVNQGLMKADVVGIRLKAAVISLVYKRVSKRSKHNIKSHNKPYHYLRVSVIPTQYFVQSRNPNGYLWHPTSLDIFYPESSLDFPNPELQIREIPDRGKPNIGDAH